MNLPRLTIVPAKAPRARPVKDYRRVLRLKGRAPLKGPLRTTKQTGDHELFWDAKAGVYVGGIVG